MGWMETERFAVFATGVLLTLACGSTPDDQGKGGASSGGSSGSSASSGAENRARTENRAGTASSEGGSAGDLGGGAGNDTGGVGGPIASEGKLRVEIEAKAIASNPMTGVLYAVVSSSDPTFGNMLLELDEAGRVLSSVAIGSDPDTIAVSDDGTTMWLGLHANQQVMKVDLTGAAPVPGESFALPPVAATGKVHPAGPMVVLAGTTTTLAVSTHSDIGSPSFKGVVILDDGVPLPAVTPVHTGAARLTSGPPGYLFGFNDQTSGYQFYTLEVHANGVTQTAFTDLVEGAWDLLYIEGYVLAAGGEVVDVSDPAAPTLIGELGHNGLVQYDPEQHSVVMLSCGSLINSFRCSGVYGLVLRRFDLTTLTEIESKLLGPEILQSTSQLTRFGANRFAFIGKLDSPRNDAPSAIYILDP
jgi:hypothetical protein